MKKDKISPRLWVTIILVGLSGQFAWTIENMYFNVFLYNTISTDPNFIATMVAASAIAATLATLLMGALSDRMGKRKAFVVVGYILWGITTGAFGFITVENAAKLFPGLNAAASAAVMVVILDCVMSFFGSTANDGAFNAYITDCISNENRCKAEGVLATLPMISMLVIFGLFDGMTQRGEWRKFFMLFGVMVIVVGVAAIFLMKDSPNLQPRKDSYIMNLLYGFRPSVVKENADLYLSFLTHCLFSIGVQVFFPYLIIYMQTYLHFDNYAIILGIVLIFASAVSISMGGVIDRVGKLRFVYPALAVMVVGLVWMFFVREFVVTIISGCVMMSGFMLLTAVTGANIRDYTPTDKAGLFQGIRMIFSVLVPMVVGPFIGSAVIKN
ncbi:MAG: MFS transporter, partial [Oscillospiraceae bacterium]|nr:MFS transporter [Oscillospiraceae bacterium]